MYKGIFSMIYKKLLGERYGLDELGKFSLFALAGLIILDIFVDSYIVGLLQVIVIALIIFRFMSKNIFKRLKENEVFCDIRYAIFKPFKNIKRNLTDRGHIYKRCSCGTTIKVGLPKKRGIKHTTCPNCKKRVRIVALRKQN